MKKFIINKSSIIVILFIVFCNNYLFSQLNIYGISYLTQNSLKIKIKILNLSSETEYYFPLSDWMLFSVDNRGLLLSSSTEYSFLNKIYLAEKNDSEIKFGEFDGDFIYQIKKLPNIELLESNDSLELNILIDTVDFSTKTFKNKKLLIELNYSLSEKFFKLIKIFEKDNIYLNNYINNNNFLDIFLPRTKNPKFKFVNYSKLKINKYQANYLILSFSDKITVEVPIENYDK